MHSSTAKTRSCRAIWRLFLVTAALALLSGLCPTPAVAAAQFQYEEDGHGGVCIIGTEGDVPASLVLPTQVDGLPVRAIGPHAFRGMAELLNVTLPDGLERIDEGAFYGCSALRSVQLPASLTQIGEDAFAHCDALSAIALPDGLSSLGAGAFWHCSSLTKITVPAALTVLPEGAFGYCSSLSSIVLNDTLVEIGPMALAGTALERVVLPDSVESLGNAAFNACPNLQSLTIPSGITDIPEEMAADCIALTEVVLPPTVLSIGTQAFSHCEALEQIQLPARLESIGDNAFWACTALTSVNVPDGIEVIPPGAFWDCSSLSEISLPAGIRSVGSMAFYGTSLENVYFAGTQAQWDAIEIAGKGWTQAGAEPDVSNAPLLNAEVHFEEDGTRLPPGVRIRAYSRLWVDVNPELGTLLRGATLETAPSGITTADILGQFVIPETVDARIVSEGGAVRPNDAPAATGDTLTMAEQGASPFSAEIVVCGDVLGTGKMSLSQVVRIAAAYRGTRPVFGIYLLAGDFTQSGSIDLTDVVREAQLYREAAMTARH